MDDWLSLRDTSHLLHMPTQEVVRLAETGRLPGQKHAGRWEFNRRALMDQLVRDVTSLPGARLADLEVGLAGGTFHPEDRAPEMLLGPLLCEAGVEPALTSRSKAGALADLVKIAERTELVWDPAALLDAVRRREELCSTALGEGLAAPHPRRCPPNAIAESFVVVARTPGGIHWGAVDKRPSDLLFLVACTEELVHLQVLARLCRILRNPAVPEALRAAATAEEMVGILREAEPADIKAAPGRE